MPKEKKRLTTNLFKKRFKDFIEDCQGISIYFRLKNDLLRCANIDNGALDKIKDEVCSNLMESIVGNPRFHFLRLSNTDDRNPADVMHIFDFANPDEIGTFVKINQAEEASEQAQQVNYAPDRNAAFEDVNAIIIVLEDSQGRKLTLYQKKTNFSVLKEHTNLCNVFYDGATLKQLDQNILQINNKYMCLKFSKLFMVRNVDQFEKDSGFRDIISKKAGDCITFLDQSGLVKDVEPLKQSAKQLPFAKKLTKVLMHSGVISAKVSNEKIIDFVKSKDYLEKVKLTEDEQQFDLKLKYSQNKLLEILDEAYLKSELTGHEFYVRAKDRKK
ncbi:Kiwa anti-phage protein KwaB-like domain-containing protein [Vibrio parahaemolyticus]|uniref:Kiwa anti-phage protein KwaB-like domain-containing protein n=1 Tax=Vibrio parahaemolyticus TaxID=670 RepID=UPI002362E35D|nr:Kiwa anti-phage protein KwaB-like domain-containing protein [Vibrio parahaemolyticus]MEA5293287.1 DUF4868 domain-containing protein [Vibrio parahaemolyticus]